MFYTLKLYVEGEEHERMDKPKLLKPKDCPLCSKIIYTIDRNGRPIKLNSEGTTFWVRCNDGSEMEFAICNECLGTLTEKQAHFIMDSQIFTWGQEIIGLPVTLIELVKQLSWYVNTAVLLRVDTFAHTKEGLG